MEKGTIIIIEDDSDVLASLQDLLSSTLSILCG
jgi:hypothetical protein